jgi:hypothetical protein
VIGASAPGYSSSSLEKESDDTEADEYRGLVNNMYA